MITCNINQPEFRIFSNHPFRSHCQFTNPTYIFFHQQYGELSLTTNPGYALYSTPLRAYNCIPSPTSQVTPIIRSKSPPNIYTRLPMKDYTTVIASPTTNMSNYGISHQQQLTSPNKHLLIATTPFMENGVPTSTTTVPALHSPYGQRMPLLNTNYATAINNRINNGNITNGVKSQLIITKVESWKNSSLPIDRKDTVSLSLMCHIVRSCAKIVAKM